MSENRYFKVEYDDEWYLFDSNTISEELVTEQAEYGYGVFANSLSPSEIEDLLNEMNDDIQYLNAFLVEQGLATEYLKWNGDCNTGDYLMGKNICNDCKHFTGYDGVNELWTGCTYGDFRGSKKVCENYNKKTTKTDLQNRIKELEKENERLKELIKKYVFGKYVGGSLADLKFKAIAYDDIVNLEISNESEPKVIVICKQGKKANVKSFCQMFIPFGISYEIKEVS